MSENWKQVIIARKDLNMSPGKLAAQVSHASMAYFMYKIKHSTSKKLAPNFECFRTVNGDKRQRYRNPALDNWCEEAYNKGLLYFYCKKIPDKNTILGYRLVLVENQQKKEYEYVTKTSFDEDMYENWIEGSFTKVVCEAKNKNKLMKAVEFAATLGLKENEDYFIIRDNCLTELEPEEVDENGVGRTVTCIGFAPLPAATANQISKKFQLYK